MEKGSELSNKLVEDFFTNISRNSEGLSYGNLIDIASAITYNISLSVSEGTRDDFETVLNVICRGAMTYHILENEKVTKGKECLKSPSEE